MQKHRAFTKLHYRGASRALHLQILWCAILIFRSISQLIQRFWPWLIALWLVVAGGLWWSAPDWNSVATRGEFNFLPQDSPTRLGEQLLQQAFPNERKQSSIVIVVARYDEKPLSDTDKSFITGNLRTELEQLKQSDSRSVILEVKTFTDEKSGPLFISNNERAALLTIELSQGFYDQNNRIVIERVEQQLAKLTREEELPSGLRVELTGSAVVGRDELRAKERSAENIEAWTVWLVLGLLIVVYRAPILAMIPLLTLYLSIEIALRLTALLAAVGWIDVFDGQEIYTRVIVYGAGVDYSLFLLSRYQEEYQQGYAAKLAAGTAIERVGTAIAASATTEIFGIGMLMLMSFRKFQQAGLSIALGFLVMLLTSLLLTPALLCLVGRFAFWPFALSKNRKERRDESGNSHQQNNPLWDGIASGIEKRPGTVWIATMFLLAPFACWGFSQSDRLSFGIVSELPSDAPSRAGTELLSRNFPSGKAGPVTVLVRNDEADLMGIEGEAVVEQWTDNLWSHREELQIADIISLAQPQGVMADSTQEADSDSDDGSLFGRLLKRSAERKLSKSYFISDAGEFKGDVARARIVLSQDPFARNTIEEFDSLHAAVMEALPESLEGSSVYLLGSTANLSDLKAVAERDRKKIHWLVTGAVLAILIVMLRRISLSVYLIVLILFGYFATIGVTMLFFEWWQGEKFVGLDWTVPIFLFTVLIAVGEDYNIFLIARVDEEQERHGPGEGVTEALKRTGGIISGCGIIMAGTFSSLIFGGELAGLQQLGFALAFGVLLDTFVIRTFLVPTWLTLLNEGRFGRLSRWLGGRPVHMNPSQQNPSAER